MIFQMLAGADPGFGIRGGGVSRRGVWGPLNVPESIRYSVKNRLWTNQKLMCNLDGCILSGADPGFVVRGGRE